jgi:hypothetical protein
MVMDTRPLVHPPLAALGQYFQLATAGKAWMTPEDVREEIGLPPIENADELNPPPPQPVVVGDDNAEGQ